MIWAGTTMVSNNVFFIFVFIFINLLWGSVDNSQPLHELHNNKSLRTFDVDNQRLAFKNYVFTQLTIFQF